MKRQEEGAKEWLLGQPPVAPGAPGLGPWAFGPLGADDPGGSASTTFSAPL